MNTELAIRLRNKRIEEHKALQGLPPRWRNEIVRKVIEACKHFTLPKIVDSIADQFISEFRKEHVLNGLDLTASDSEIVETARRRANGAAMMLSRASDPEIAEAIIERTCAQADVPQPKGETITARVKRISCENWWRRKLRTNHARTIENGNIKLGIVRAKREPYASRDAVYRCLRQEDRNRKMMEKTILQNEHGDRFSLQELAELSTSNKAIRRAELMTRIRGMEDFASEYGYAALFVTITCPSYFHATSHASGKAAPNPLYRGMTPRQGQTYLCKVWSQIRAKLDREGIAAFGLRVAEPHHDGCPHWHLIVFVKQDEASALESVVRHYALLDSPDEPGAQKHRCKFVQINAEQGSATGYVAKYIAKNIDGYKLETDLNGEPAITASIHVTAWAKTHGIRQFQAFGAGSVMVWRELRRIPFDAVKDAPEHLQQAWHAAQKQALSDGEGFQRADYAKYLKAIGGAAIPRKHALIRLAKVHYDTPGRYGEPMGEKPIGIVASDAPFKIYESIRYQWQRVESHPHGVKPIATDGASQAQAALQKIGFGSAWTRVNNCTQDRPMPNAATGGIPSKNFNSDRMRC
jgi:hypothetical protein